MRSALFAAIDAAYAASLKVLEWGERICEAPTDDFAEFANTVEQCTQERGSAMRTALAAIQNAQTIFDEFSQKPETSAADRAFAQEKMLRLSDLRPQFAQQDAALTRLIKQQLKNHRADSAQFNHNAGVIRQYLGLKKF
jgi:hypothetical protein